MPNLKSVTKELRQEIVSYLIPFPTISSSLAFRLATLIFAKTRFCSHINFIGRCLQSKVIPKGFRSNFHASEFSHSGHKYLSEILCAQNAFSRRVMRITIRAMCQKRDDLDQCIIECRSQLCQNCPAVLVESIRDKIQQLNSKLFQFLQQIKTQKFTNLVGPSSNLEPPKGNQQTVITIPNNFPLSEPEKSVLSKDLNFVPIAKRTEEFSVKQDLEKFLRRVKKKKKKKKKKKGFTLTKG